MKLFVAQESLPSFYQLLAYIYAINGGLKLTRGQCKSLKQLIPEKITSLKTILQSLTDFELIDIISDHQLSWNKIVFSAKHLNLTTDELLNLSLTKELDTKLEKRILYLLAGKGSHPVFWVPMKYVDNVGQAMMLLSKTVLELRVLEDEFFKLMDARELSGFPFCFCEQLE